MPRQVRPRKEIPAVEHSSSDEEEKEPDEFVDSGEEDWQPEVKKNNKGKRRKSVSTTPKGRREKKAKNDDSDESDDDEDSDQVNEAEEKDTGDDEPSGKHKNGAKKSSIGKNEPDADGNMELNVFKNDLRSNYANDETLCMWRRDRTNLLQKYIVVPSESNENHMVFKASSVYSCWEETRKTDFFQIVVKVIGDKTGEKVKVANMAEFIRLAYEDRPLVDITPRGAEGSVSYDDDEEEKTKEEAED